MCPWCLWFPSKHQHWLAGLLRKHANKTWDLLLNADGNQNNWEELWLSSLRMLYNNRLKLTFYNVIVFFFMTSFFKTQIIPGILPRWFSKSCDYVTHNYTLFANIFYYSNVGIIGANYCRKTSNGTCTEQLGLSLYLYLILFPHALSFPPSAILKVQIISLFFPC